MHDRIGAERLNQVYFADEGRVVFARRGLEVLRADADDDTIVAFESRAFFEDRGWKRDRLAPEMKLILRQVTLIEVHRRRTDELCDEEVERCVVDRLGRVELL